MQNNYFDSSHPLRPYTHSAPAMPGTVAPVNALRKALPKAKKGYHWGESEGVWTYIEDHKGEEGYVNGVAHTIDDYGPYPDGWSTTPPEPTEEEKRQVRIVSIDARLDEIDRESIRPLRAIADGSATGSDKAKLAALEQEAAARREERTQLAAV